MNLTELEVFQDKEEGDLDKAEEAEPLVAERIQRRHQIVVAVPLKLRPNLDPAIGVVEAGHSVVVVAAAAGLRLSIVVASSVQSVPTIWLGIRSCPVPLWPPSLRPLS